MSIAQAITSLFVKSAVGDVFIPAGDPAEQIIANLILSVVVCQLHSEKAAQSFVIRAHELAEMLARHSAVYQPARPSRFARLTYEIDNKSDGILYSIIDDVLVVPTLANNAIVRPQQLVQGAIRLVSLTPTRYTLRMRPRKVLAELAALGEIASERLYDSVDRILQKCLQQELPRSEPLDRASESFTLARDLIGKRNYSLAVLALNDASAALDSYANASPIPSHLPLTLAMRTQIAGMLDQIRHRGM
jgi:hypothetical protein